MLIYGALKINNIYFTLGASHDRLAEEAKHFKEFKLERVAQKLKKPPKATGC